MESLEAPKRMDFTANLGGNWKRFKQRYEIYRLAFGAGDMDAKTQVALLLHIMGEEVIEVYNSFQYENAADKNKYEIVMNKLDTYFTPKKNLVLERWTFNRIAQEPSEDLDHFVTRLKTVAQNRDFSQLKDSLIRD